MLTKNVVRFLKKRQPLDPNSPEVVGMTKLVLADPKQFSELPKKICQEFKSGEEFLPVARILARALNPGEMHSTIEEMRAIHLRGKELADVLEELIGE